MPIRPARCPHGHILPHENLIDFNHRELYLQICYPEDDGAVHWLIFMKCPGSDRGTRFHSTGWKGHRTLSMELDKRYDSRSVEDIHYLGKIHVSDSIIVPLEAEKIPLQSCQLWACYLMLRLERKGLLKRGTFDYYMHNYGHRRDEDYGPGRDVECAIHHHRR